MELQYTDLIEHPSDVLYLAPPVYIDETAGTRDDAAMMQSSCACNSCWDFYTPCDPNYGG